METPTFLRFLGEDPADYVVRMSDGDPDGSLAKAAKYRQRVAKVDGGDPYKTLICSILFGQGFDPQRIIQVGGPTPLPPCFRFVCYYPPSYSHMFP
jgi:hypothetical protein